MLVQCWHTVDEVGVSCLCWLVILCLEGSVISFISPSSGRFSWPSLAYMYTKNGVKPHSFHFIFADSPSCSPRSKSGRLRADQTRPRRVRIAYSRYPRRSSSCCPPALPGACNRLSNMPRITIGLFGPFSAGTVFRRQNLTFIDVRF